MRINLFEQSSKTQFISEHPSVGMNPPQLAVRSKGVSGNDWSVGSRSIQRKSWESQTHTHSHTLTRSKTPLSLREEIHNLTRMTPATQVSHLPRWCVCKGSIWHVSNVALPPPCCIFTHMLTLSYPNRPFATILSLAQDRFGVLFAFSLRVRGDSQASPSLRFTLHNPFVRIAAASSLPYSSTRNTSWSCSFRRSRVCSSVRLSRRSLEDVVASQGKKDNGLTISLFPTRYRPPRSPTFVNARTMFTDFLRQTTRPQSQSTRASRSPSASSTTSTSSLLQHKLLPSRRRLAQRDPRPRLQYQEP